MSRNISHWYTIHIFGGLKCIPHSSRTYVYTFIMEVDPSWSVVKDVGNDMTFSNYLWPTVYRDHLLIDTYLVFFILNYECICWVVRELSLAQGVGIPTNNHTDRHVQSNMSLLLRKGRGINSLVQDGKPSNSIGWKIHPLQFLSYFSVFRLVTSCIYRFRNLFD